MRIWYLRSGKALLQAGVLLFVPSAGAQQHTVDAQKSTLTVRAYKTGLFSAFAHDHEIAAPILRGVVEIAEHASVRMEVDARTLRVMDPGVSDKDRGEIQQTMLGPEVLDSELFHEIIFQSAAVERDGPEQWIVRGSLTLHGQTQPVVAKVLYEAGHYKGNVTIKQTNFGIKPVRVAGGAVKVKDEVRIEFDVQLTP